MKEIEVDPNIIYSGPTTTPFGTHFQVNRVSGRTPRLEGAIAILNGKRWKILSVKPDPTGPMARVIVRVEKA